MIQYIKMCYSKTLLHCKIHKYIVNPYRWWRNVEKKNQLLYITLLNVLLSHFNLIFSGKGLCTVDLLSRSGIFQVSQNLRPMQQIWGFVALSFCQSAEIQPDGDRELDCTHLKNVLAFLWHKRLLYVTVI